MKKVLVETTIIGSLLFTGCNIQKNQENDTCKNFDNLKICKNEIIKETLFISKIIKKENINNIKIDEVNDSFSKKEFKFLDITFYNSNNESILRKTIDINDMVSQNISKKDIIKTLKENHYPIQTTDLISLDKKIKQTIQVINNLIEVSQLYKQIHISYENISAKSFKETYIYNESLIDETNNSFIVPIDDSILISLNSLNDNKELLIGVSLDNSNDFTPFLKDIYINKLKATYSNILIENENDNIITLKIKD